MTKKRILGLDTGTNSLGWAVVDQEESGQYTLIDKGVVIFQEGVKIEKGVESSKAAERTEHRALRRQYFRRRLRKIEVLRALMKYDLCPALTEEDLKLWKQRKIYPKKDEFMVWQRTNDNEDINPYHCRYICLNEVLNLDRQQDRYTLGRAFYHMAQRRGFLSNRLDATEEDENGAVKSSIANLNKEIEGNGCKYLGEYFYKLYKEKGNTVRIRTRYTDREQHYKKEFFAICEKQNLPKEMVEELTRALYFQRPLKSQRQNVGNCTFEKGKPRCSDSHPMYEEFRMLSLLNNVRIQGPWDDELRPLNEEELDKIEPLFYRKSKPNFDFEDIAKKIAGKGKYQWKGDAKTDLPYKFNYRMSQGVSGCPTIAQLKEVFGGDWKEGLAETYTQNTNKDGTQKSVDEMVSDIWNVLFFFDSKDKVKEFGLKHLQLDEEQAEKFSKIRLSRNYASLSLKAIRNILPFLQMGMLYSDAVFFAKVPAIVGQSLWQERQSEIQEDLTCAIHMAMKEKRRIDETVKDYLQDNFDLKPGAAELLYHPSMIETYPDAKPNKDGVVLLGSPRTNAVKNPMAMRSLHEVRKVVNSLIKEGKIGPDTEVHIEYARALNNANMRAAINDLQREKDKKHKEYAEEIRKLYKEATGKDIEPTETDILKFQLWEEQKHICLYTGDEIGIADFIGAGPSYDIEHTIPQSVGGDSTQMNMTLCSTHYNRFVKKAKLPAELPEHESIMARIEPWKEHIEDLTKQIDRLGTRGIWDKAAKDARIRKRNRLKMERDYWLGKYKRFTMTEVPEGFALRQGAGIGLISKYAALYLKSYFHNAEQRQVYSIKGAVTADFRKMWGIQEEYEKKSRDNHTHHCIDAIVIACIDLNGINESGKFHHKQEDFKAKDGSKLIFDKPWPTFTQDLKQIAEELLVVHDTPDNMPKKASRKMEVNGRKVVAKGDCARGSLHNDMYYGAIERNGQIKYVIRKELRSIKENDIENIVDDVVKEKVKRAIAEKGFKKAMEEDIYMNKDKGIKIKKVRCITPSVTNPLHIRTHRDKSRKEYKQQFHVTLDGNYCMAIYEGEVKGKTKRTYEIVNMIDAASYFKKSTNLMKQGSIVPESKNGLKYRCIVRTGTQILLLQSDDEKINLADKEEIAKRFYHVAVMRSDGRIVLRYNQDARDATTLKKERKSGAYKVGEQYRSEIMLSLSDFHALVEGVDFTITPLGEIKLKH
ncbi:MAG: CRISPR-associated protein Csn1 [Bacteroidaceae bacterium]|nr:CRISPR-associated protein Csn1 [Bacteroidaceae bacterium]